MGVMPHFTVLMRIVIDAENRPKHTVYVTVSAQFTKFRAGAYPHPFTG